MSSYCPVPGCNSYRRTASCQGRTFQHFPVNSKIHHEWTKWCANMNRLHLRCSSVLVRKLPWAKLAWTNGDMATSSGWNEYLMSKYTVVGHICDCYGWLRYESNNTGKLRFIDIICKATVYCDYEKCVHKPKLFKKIDQTEQKVLL